MTGIGKHLKARTFSRAVVMVLLGLMLAIIGGVGYLISQTKRQVAKQYVNQAAVSASSDFIAMNRSMEASLTMLREWGAAGLIRLSDEKKLGQLFLPIFTREPLLNGISVADINGGSFFIKPDGDRLRTRLVSVEKKKETTTYWTREFELLESSTTNSTYDPRTRPWFSPAFEAEGIHWTAPYIFFSSKRAGITASTSFLSPSANHNMVVAFDVKLDGLFRAMYALAPSQNSTIFIFKRDGNLYLPNHESAASEFLSMDEVRDDLIQKAYANWAAGRRMEGRIIRMTHNGERWWCGFAPLVESRQTSWICVMVPEGDIRHEAGKDALRLGVFGLAALALMAGLAFWIIQHYGRRIDAAESFDAEHPDEAVRKLIEGGEGRHVEFKSTMRMNLHSKKPGKEIELAWLKGVCAFLNTDGGILLLGVTDAGEITGIEQDVFENDDKCYLHFKNLIGRHIGAEMSKYIDFKLVPMDGKTVGVVRCSRARQPAFLKEVDKEMFYIRNGPASDELPVSKVLSYIKQRK